MSESKIVIKFSQIIASKIFLLIACTLIFCLSIFLRSIIDIGPDTGVYLDLGREISRGSRYYYEFFESNFPLSFYIYALEHKFSQLCGISPIIMSEIFINALALLSIFWSAKILRRSTFYQNRSHYNLIIIAYFLGFFIRGNVIQLGEFGTKSSFLLICLFPYISFSFARLVEFKRSELISRGILMGLIPCFKPHYIIFPLLLELNRFYQTKSPRNLLKFLSEIDKLVMLLVGVIYLFLMLKLTPEFFEFVVPMWPKIYSAYDDPKIFFDNFFHRLADQTAIYCFIFLVFTRLKFTPNDRVLLVLFLATSILITLENIGTIDQIGVLFATFTICFLKIIYDLIVSQKFSFRDNKFIMIALLIFPIFEMEVLPKAIFGLSGFINIWWLVALVYPFIFCYGLHKKDRQKFSNFKKNYLTFAKISLAILVYFVLLAIVVLFLKYQGFFGFMATNLFALFLVLFCFEKFYSKFEEKFSHFAVLVITASISCLLYAYIHPLSNLIPSKHYDTYPNKLSDAISYYSEKFAPQKQDSFLVFSDLIAHQFPVMNYLNKENYHVHNIERLIAKRGFLGSSAAFPLSNDRDEIFTLDYLFRDVKKQISNKDLKIIFINSRTPSFYQKDRCLIGFLEYYFTDPQFRKMFLQNFRFENRILTSVKIKNPVALIPADEEKKEDVFAQVKPSNEIIRYDFEVYVRK